MRHTLHCTLHCGIQVCAALPTGWVCTCRVRDSNVVGDGCHLLRGHRPVGRPVRNVCDLGWQITQGCGRWSLCVDLEASTVATLGIHRSMHRAGSLRALLTTPTSPVTGAGPTLGLLVRGGYGWSERSDDARALTPVAAQVCRCAIGRVVGCAPVLDGDQVIETPALSRPRWCAEVDRAPAEVTDRWQLGFQTLGQLGPLRGMMNRAHDCFSLVIHQGDQPLTNSSVRKWWCPRCRSYSCAVMPPHRQPRRRLCAPGEYEVFTDAREDQAVRATGSQGYLLVPRRRRVRFSAVRGCCPRSRGASRTLSTSVAR